MSLLSSAEAAVRRSLKLGADESEAYARKTRTVEVVLERAEIQSERVKIQQGVGIRLIKDKKLGFAFASDLSVKSVQATCENALNLAKSSVANPDWVALPKAARLPKLPQGLFDPKVAALSGSEVLGLALRAYNAVKDCDKRAVIDDGKFSAMTSDVAVSNSQGVEAAEKYTLLYGFVVCVAKAHGQTSSMAFEYDVTRNIKFSPEKIGRSAAEKAVASLKPSKGESFVGKVILDSDPASEILFSPVISSVNADNVQRRRSLWMDKIGQLVAVPQLNLTDDGLLPKGVGSSSFDAEGVPRQRTPLITKGKLKAFLHNSFTANKEKRKSTGNAERESYNALPTVLISNLIVEPGKKKLDDVISEVDKGIIVRRFSGNVRPDSGEFSGIAKQASYIEKGEITHALRETMISGNAYTALKSIVIIGSEIRPTFDRVYTPPILIDNVNVVSK